MLRPDARLAKMTILVSRTRFLVVALVLIVGGGAAFVASRGDGARPTRPQRPPQAGNCLEDPPEIETPAWYPDDLPMPTGSYAIKEHEEEGGLRKVSFSTAGNLQVFVRHALEEWPKHGWTLGVGESEPGEAEDNFLKGERYGVFQARSIMCAPDRTWVLMVVNDPAVKDAPTPGFNTANPSATPSPLNPSASN